MAEAIGGITDDVAGLARAAEVLSGLCDYHPERQSTGEVVIVHFDVTGE